VGWVARFHSIMSDKLSFGGRDEEGRGGVRDLNFTPRCRKKISCEDVSRCLDLISGAREVNFDQEGFPAARRKEAFKTRSASSLTHHQPSFPPPRQLFPGHNRPSLTTPNPPLRLLSRLPPFPLLIFEGGVSWEFSVQPEGGLTGEGGGRFF